MRTVSQTIFALMLLICVSLVTLYVPRLTNQVIVHGASVQASIYDCDSQPGCNSSGFGFNPPHLNTTTGTTVTWSNTGTFEHTTSNTDTSQVWDSGTIRPGGAFSYTFNQPGFFQYQCNIHPFMKGTLNVTGPPASNGGGPPPPGPPGGMGGDSSPFPLIYALVAVLSVVSGLSGTLYYARRRRSSRKK